MDVDTVYLNAKMIDGKPVFMKIGPLIAAVLAQLNSSFKKFHDRNGDEIKERMCRISGAMVLGSK